jgi:hypothetical protein
MRSLFPAPGRFRRHPPSDQFATLTMTTTTAMTTTTTQEAAEGGSDHSRGNDGQVEGEEGGAGGSEVSSRRAPYGPWSRSEARVLPSAGASKVNGPIRSEPGDIPTWNDLRQAHEVNRAAATIPQIPGLPANDVDIYSPGLDADLVRGQQGRSRMMRMMMDHRRSAVCLRKA